MHVIRSDLKMQIRPFKESNVCVFFKVCLQEEVKLARYLSTCCVHAETVFHVIIPPVHTAHEEISSLCVFNLSDGGQYPVPVLFQNAWNHLSEASAVWVKGIKCILQNYSLFTTKFPIFWVAVSPLQSRETQWGNFKLKGPKLWKIST